MNNSIKKEPEIQELKRDIIFWSAPEDKTDKETTKSMKEPDTLVSMIVLLLTCFALAALAHVVVP
jgi:hypothetical protein